MGLGPGYWGPSPSARDIGLVVGIKPDYRKTINNSLRNHKLKKKKKLKFKQRK